MEKPKSRLAQWLEERCREESLSLREAGKRAGMSHATIGDIMKGARPSGDTIRKLAGAFSGNGNQQKLVLEDELLIMAGYRSPRPDGGGETNQPLAKLMDAVSEFSRLQLKLMLYFAEYLSETTVKRGRRNKNAD